MPTLHYATTPRGCIVYWRLCGFLTLFWLALLAVAWLALLFAGGLRVFTFAAPAANLADRLLLLASRTALLPLVVSLAGLLAFWLFVRLSWSRRSRVLLLTYLGTSLVPALFWMGTNIALVLRGPITTHRMGGSWTMIGTTRFDVTFVAGVLGILLLPVWLLVAGLARRRVPEESPLPSPQHQGKI